MSDARKNEKQHAICACGSADLLGGIPIYLPVGTTTSSRFITRTHRGELFYPAMRSQIFTTITPRVLSRC